MTLDFLQLCCLEHVALVKVCNVRFANAMRAFGVFCFSSLQGNKLALLSRF